MADKKKSILEEAILNAKMIQEALNANTEEILRSVTKEEINSVVKESLEEEDYVVEDVDTEELEDADEDAEMEIEAPEGEEMEVDVEADVEADMGSDVENMETDMEGDDLEGNYETGMDAEIASDDEVEMDMTAASDEDVIAVYKKLTGNDEIEVVVDDEAGEVKLSVNEPGEFVIKTGAGKGAEVADAEPQIEDEDVMYEIALDEAEDIESVKAPLGNKNKDNFAGDNLEGGFEEDQTYAKAEGDMVMNEEEDCNEGEVEEALYEEEVVEESEEEINEEEDCNEGEDTIEEKVAVGTGMSVGNRRNPKGPGSIGAPENPKAMNEAKVKYNNLLSEANELKAKGTEYKKALKHLRTMLAETVVFNSNLTYVTKLFMEHATTKQEKENIFKKFDNEVSTLKESKKLYKTIASDLGNRKPMNESIESKITKEVSSSKSANLNESTAYVDNETSRILDLMNRTNKR